MKTRARLLMAVFLLSGLPALAKEKIKLMYLESEQETRAAVLINRLELPLENLKKRLDAVMKEFFLE